MASGLTFSRMASISLALYQTISSRMLRGLFSSWNSVTPMVMEPSGCAACPWGGRRRMATSPTACGAALDVGEL
jgi:hypothetical protein